jgi:hypothetical protein
VAGFVFPTLTTLKFLSATKFELDVNLNTAGRSALPFRTQ